MGSKRSAVSSASPAKAVTGWVGRQSTRVKAILGVAIGLLTLVGLKLWVRNHNHFFVASEAIHAAGIFVLVYKLTTQKTCSGLSLRSQGLTALFLAVRLFCSVFMEADIHTMLDFASLVSTLWVIYMMWFKLKATYVKELDNMPLYYLMIEPFTSHYVFALGIARFLACAHWIIRVIETRGAYLYIAGSGYFWFPVAFLAEMVQTFILADFCYYYVKSFMAGQLVMRMPV
ncbi:unnamed protein product [Linum tenue]|uniref:ER lumen protein retaining receptor n=1 Tax=Linum tenue TaxID=586396 RepID=A0AAV0RU88_9ROSI|nr:unnamed protein product [Linum tenue]